jgi:hypothetical protein
MSFSSKNPSSFQVFFGFGVFNVSEKVFYKLVSGNASKKTLSPSNENIDVNQ